MVNFHALANGVNGLIKQYHNLLLSAFHALGPAYFLPGPLPNCSCLPSVDYYQISLTVITPQLHVEF